MTAVCYALHRILRLLLDPMLTLALPWPQAYFSVSSTSGMKLGRLEVAVLHDKAPLAAENLVLSVQGGCGVYPEYTRRQLCTASHWGTGCVAVWPGALNAKARPAWCNCHKWDIAVARAQ